MKKSKRKSKKQKQEKIRSYQQAFNRIDKYNSNVIAGKEAINPIMDVYAKELSKYRNKNGTLSKRATRSNKAKRRFNALITDILRSKESKVSERKKALSEKRKVMNKGLLTLAGEGKEAQAVKTHEVLKENIFEGFLSSSEYYHLVLEASEDDEVSAEDIIDVLQAIQDRMVLETPLQSKALVLNDGRSVVLEEIFKGIDELEEDKSITVEEHSERLIDLIVKALQKIDYRRGDKE